MAPVLLTRKPHQPKMKMPAQISSHLPERLSERLVGLSRGRKRMIQLAMDAGLIRASAVRGADGLCDAAKPACVKIGREEWREQWAR